MRRLRSILNNSHRQLQETTILIIGDLGRHPQIDIGEICEALLFQLGSPSTPIRSLAYCELRELATHREKTPWNLLSPHFDRLSVFLAGCLVNRPDTVSEAMHLLGTNRQTFFSSTTGHTVPALVVATNREALEQVAAVLKGTLGGLLLDNMAQILARVFLSTHDTDKALQFFLALLRQLIRSDVTASSVMTSCNVPFVVALIIELGDIDPIVSRSATTALLRAQRAQNGDILGADLGTFLKPHMLGVISQLNETLHDVQGKKSVEFKQKVIRSLGSLIDTVGDSMSSFSPQIMASLQSTLGIKELREETLRTWRRFVKTLRYADVGPFVGRTTAALVNNWKILSEPEKRIAKDIIDEIAGNNTHLQNFIDEVVGMDGIPELAKARTQLLTYRESWSVKLRLEKVLDRTRSKNIAVATTSMAELRDLLLVANPKQREDLNKLILGFDEIVPKIISNLLLNVTRDGDCDDLRQITYQCFGIIGAIDPDRLTMAPEAVSMTLLTNFTREEETIDFALHLIRDLLVDAFRATNDTKHQNHLAYAIQELLSFCGFSQKPTSQ